MMPMLFLDLDRGNSLAVYGGSGSSSKILICVSKTNKRLKGGQT